jgi:ABC-type uncharacterized transport system substrate-binding protein
MISRSVRILICALAWCCVAAVSPANAHPHVWVTMKAEVIYAPDGSVKAVRHAWAFDESYSVFATQGIETKKKDQFTREELMPLAKVNVESLKEYDYFTDAKVNGNKVQFGEPIDYHLEYDPKETVLTLHFTLPFNVPVKAKEVELNIFDPSIFVDFALAENKPVTLVGAARQCKLSVAGPQRMDASTMSRLGQLDATTQLDPSEWFGAQFANKISVKCP